MWIDLVMPVGIEKLRDNIFTVACGKFACGRQRKIERPVATSAFDIGFDLAQEHRREIDGQANIWVIVKQRRHGVVVANAM